MFFLSVLTAFIIDLFTTIATLLGEIGKIILPAMFLGIKTIFNFFFKKLKK